MGALVVQTLTTHPLSTPGKDSKCRDSGMLVARSRPNWTVGVAQPCEKRGGMKGRDPSNTLCREFADLLVDNMDVPATPLSAYQIPRTFTLDKNHNAMAVAAPGDSAVAPPPRPPKPSQAETPRWGSPQQRPPLGESSRSVSAAATIPRRNTLPAMDNSRLHRGQSEPWRRAGGGGWPGASR